MNRVGLNVRLTSTMAQALQQGREIGAKIIQTFVTRRDGSYAEIAQEQANIEHERTHIDQLFLHTSYHVNLANDKLNGVRALTKELEMAQRMQATAVVLHPGAGGKHQTRKHAIETLARNLDQALKKFPEAIILLENAAHNGRALGGPLQELATIRSLSDYQDRLLFCVDSAHAHVWGYHLNNDFNNEVHTHLETENVRLFHLNDASQARGSAVDQHATPGQGTIGMQSLVAFAGAQQFATIPIICELPIMTLEQEATIITTLSEELKKHPPFVLSLSKDTN